MVERENMESQRNETKRALGVIIGECEAITRQVVALGEYRRRYKLTLPFFDLESVEAVRHAAVNQLINMRVKDSSILIDGDVYSLREGGELVVPSP